MTVPGDETGLSSKAAVLRRSFDDAFARAPVRDQQQLEDFLAIRVASDPYVLRLEEVAGLFAHKEVTPIPHSVPGLLGIAALRGALLAVYDLRVLLGYPAPDPPPWFVVTGARRVALGFDGYEGHLRLSQEARAVERRTARARPHVREIVRSARAVRPIVHLASVLEAIEARPSAGIP